MAAMVTLIHMTAQNSGPAGFDGAHGTMLLSGHGSAVDLPVLRAVLPEDISELQIGPGHLSAGSGRSGSRSKGLEVSASVCFET